MKIEPIDERLLQAISHVSGFAEEMLNEHDYLYGEKDEDGYHYLDNLKESLDLVIEYTACFLQIFDTVLKLISSNVFNYVSFCEIHIPGEYVFGSFHPSIIVFRMVNLVIILHLNSRSIMASM